MFPVAANVMDDTAGLVTSDPSPKTRRTGAWIPTKRLPSVCEANALPRAEFD